MTDMPIDEHRVLRVTGRMLKRPEIEEIEEAFHRVTPEQIDAVCAEFRDVYQVDPTVTDAHMKDSAQIAVAYQEIIEKWDISAFGYYWWGERELVTQLRSQVKVCQCLFFSLCAPCAWDAVCYLRCLACHRSTGKIPMNCQWVTQAGVNTPSRLRT